MKVFATRTKSDNKSVLVCESTQPVDLKALKELLLMKSIEFDEKTRLSVHD